MPGSWGEVAHVPPTNTEFNILPVKIPNITGKNKSQFFEFYISSPVDCLLKIEFNKILKSTRK